MDRSDARKRKAELAASPANETSEACSGCGSTAAYHGVIVEVGEPQRWACDECGHIEATTDAYADADLDPALPGLLEEARRARPAHTLTEYGTTPSPVEHVRANVDDGQCSACGADLLAHCSSCGAIQR